VEVLLGSQVTAQAPGLEMFGADSVNASGYITAAEQNGQSVPANAQSAASTGSQTDVPAYSQARSTPSASASSSSAAAGSPSKPATAGQKSSSGSAAKPAGSSSSSLLYGLSACPY
jgi:hypothetical protein